MMSRRTFPWRALGGLGLILSLAGCLTPGPSSRFYVLTPTVEPTVATARAGKPRTLVISDIRLPLYLDRPQIVTREAQSGLSWSETEQWGGHLREDMGRVLAVNLGRLLPGDRVVAAPYPATTPPDGRIEVEVRNFERQPDGRVMLSAQWWITKGKDGSLLSSAETTVYGDPLAEGASSDAVVHAMSQVYGRLARSVADSLGALGCP